MKRAVNCNKDALELAYGYDVEEKWKPIIQRSKTVRIPESKEIPTEDELTELSSVWAIMERDQIVIKDNSPVIDQVKTSPRFASNFPCDIFILDSNKEEAEHVADKAGVAMFASIDEKPECLRKRDVGNVIPTGEDKCDSWEQFFIKISAMPVVPSSALIIIDRYFFLKGISKPDYQDGYYNLEHILGSVLPKDLAYPYHVLLVVQQPPSDYDTEIMYKEFDGIRSRLGRPYTIIFELAAIDRNSPVFDNTHDRKIISNYFIGDAGHSFKAYKSSNGKPRYEYQKLTYDCIYNEIDPGRFPNYSMQYAYLEFLHDYFIVTKDTIKCRCYNNNGAPCLPNELKNRLLY